MNPSLAQTVTDANTQERVLRPDGDIQLNEQGALIRLFDFALTSCRVRLLCCCCACHVL